MAIGVFLGIFRSFEHIAWGRGTGTPPHLGGEIHRFDPVSSPGGRGPVEEPEEPNGGVVEEPSWSNPPRCHVAQATLPAAQAAAPAAAQPMVASGRALREKERPTCSQREEGETCFAAGLNDLVRKPQAI